MILKKRTKPLILQKYEMLLARLPKNSPHQRAIKYELESAKRGYEGELIVDNHLKILASDFTILQDVTLMVYGDTFQMDNLLITPHILYIIEVKNPTQTITFDTLLNQFTTGEGATQTGYKHPITQVLVQKYKLETWLHEHSLPNIPIRFFIAISEPSTQIKVIGDPELIANIVMHGEHVPWKIIEYENQLTRMVDSNIDNRFLTESAGDVIDVGAVEDKQDLGSPERTEQYAKLSGQNLSKTDGHSQTLSNQSSNESTRGQHFDMMLSQQGHAVRIPNRNRHMEGERTLLPQGAFSPSMPRSISVQRVQSHEQGRTPQKFPHFQIGQTIMKHCTDFDKDILAKHGIEPKELLPGIRCYRCNALEMERVGRTWACKRCGFTDRNAAHRSTHEYLLLVKEWVTNEEIRQFLGVDSRHAVKRILNQSPYLEFSKEGNRWVRKRRPTRR